MSERDQFRESVPAWLLGALEPGESERVRAHLEECEECRADVDRLRPAMALIGLASPSTASPVGLRDRILARARETSQADVVNAPPRAWEPRVMTRRQHGQRMRLPVQAVAAMVALALVAGAVAGAVGGRLAAGEPATEVARYQLAGHGAMTGASGEVIELRKAGIAFVTFTHLPAPGEGKVYELWLIKGGANPVDAGVFVPDANGGKTVLVAQSLTGYTTVAVTAESGPDGAPAPTQQPELLGSLA